MIYLNKNKIDKNRIKARLRKTKIDIKKKLINAKEKVKIVGRKKNLQKNISEFFQAGDSGLTITFVLGIGVVPCINAAVDSPLNISRQAIQNVGDLFYIY